MNDDCYTTPGTYYGSDGPGGDTFTYQEMRISLTAFAMWLLKGKDGQGREVELVDQFIRETT